MRKEARFIAEMCERVPEEYEEVGKLYAAFLEWCGKAKTKPGSQKAFSRALEKTFERDRTPDSNRRAMFWGIRLRPEREVPEDALPF